MEGNKHKSLKVPKLYGNVKCCQDGSWPLQDFPGFGLQWDENETLGSTSLFPSPEAMASGSPFIATGDERGVCSTWTLDNTLPLSVYHAARERASRQSCW